MNLNCRHNESIVGYCSTKFAWSMDRKENRGKGRGRGRGRKRDANANTGIEILKSELN